MGVFLAFRGLDRFQVVADGFSVPGGRLLKERYVSPADEATKWVATRSARLRWRRASLSPALRERADSLFEAPDAGALHAVARMVAADRWHTALAKLSRVRGAHLPAVRAAPLTQNDAPATACPDAGPQRGPHPLRRG